MSDEGSTGGWLPPRAPDGSEAPSFGPPLGPPPEAPPPQAPPPQAPPPPSPVAYPAPPSHGAPPQYAPYQPSPKVPGANEAVVSLVTSALGLSLFILGAGIFLFIFNLPLSIAGWVLAVRARKRLPLEHPKRVQAKWGFWMGVVGVILTVIGVIVWSVLFASIDGLENDVKDFFEDLEDS